MRCVLRCVAQAPRVVLRLLHLQLLGMGCSTSGKRLGVVLLGNGQNGLAIPFPVPVPICNYINLSRGISEQLHQPCEIFTRGDQHKPWYSHARGSKQQLLAQQ